MTGRASRAPRYNEPRKKEKEKVERQEGVPLFFLFPARRMACTPTKKLLLVRYTAVRGWPGRSWG